MYLVTCRLIQTVSESTFCSKKCQEREDTLKRKEEGGPWIKLFSDFLIKRSKEESFNLVLTSWQDRGSKCFQIF